MAVFRVEKNKNYTVMSNHHFRNTELSLKAKGLLSLMLSLPENWDYTLAGLARINKDGLSSIRAAVAELEAFGYLKRRRLRNEFGQLTETEYTILEEPEPADTPSSEPICDFPILDHPTLGNPTLEKPILDNRTQLSINRSNKNETSTELSSIHPSIYPKKGSWNGQAFAADQMNEIEQYRGIIRENIEYGVIADRFGQESLDELVELMVEVVCTSGAYIRVGGEAQPTALVKSRLLKITASHIAYVFECLQSTTSKVSNIKSYLLTALYNAPATMDSYYRAEANHDLYGQK